LTSIELISLSNQVLFIGLFAVVAWRALRQPTRANLDTTLLFGAIAAAVGVSRVGTWLGISGDSALTALSLVLLNAAPFAMLRLVDDFRGTPRWVQLAGAAAFAFVSVLAVGSFVVMAELVELVTIGFFVAVGGYAAVAFATESRRTRGITRRRMAAVAVGAGFFIAAIVVVFIGALSPDLAEAAELVAQVAALAAVLAFFLGFAPPAWIRRAWREPHLRGFLERSVHLAGVADDRSAIAQLEAAASSAFGASGASIGIADADRRVLRYLTDDGGWVEHPDDAFVAGRAFSRQRRTVVVDAEAMDPEHADAYRAAGAHTIIAAPISTEERRIGVLSVYADRAPIFVEDDLWLLELLANQAAILLEARRLTLKSSALRAREEAARLKEEFLSSAAHDLRTPLTVVLGQSELLERRISRDPTAPADAAGIGRIVREARRLRDLVSELLDAQRLEQGGAITELAPADLCEIVEAVRDRHAGHGSSITVSRPDRPLVGSVDRPRIEQVIENLVENAIKYGGASSPEIVVENAEGEARIAVVDRGIGIPKGERDRIFERFFRASNVHSITDTGLGLGLYICRRIVDEHGGRIWHEPTPGGGSTFVVALPIEATSVDADRAEAAAAGSWSSPVRNGAVADA
jgi:signal transduction histidine kinase